MKLLFAWIYTIQAAKILVWPAEWSHWINMKVSDGKVLKFLTQVQNTEAYEALMMDFRNHKL